MVRLNGPRTALEFDGGCSRGIPTAASGAATAASGAASQPVPEGRLTPLSRQCAILWRELKGNRFGHFNRSAINAAALKRQKSSTSFRKVRQGVLAAARWAVASKRRGLSRQHVVHRGAGSEESPFWNKDMTRFSDQSRKDRIPGITKVRFKAAFSSLRCAAASGAGTEFHRCV